MATTDDFGTLGPAALHFGEAMCPSGDMECARKVGATWQRDIDQRFGVLTNGVTGARTDAGAAPNAAVVQRLNLLNRQGQQIGSLTMIDKQVMLCFDVPGKGDGRMCGPVGVGNESWETAQAMLSLQGIAVRGM